MKRSLVMGFFLLTGCTHSLHQVYVSDSGSSGLNYSATKVRAQAEQQVILGFVRNTDYVNQAQKSLEDQCPSSEIVGIVTEHWTSHSFFSWRNKVRMQGYCQK